MTASAVASEVEAPLTSTSRPESEAYVRELLRQTVRAVQAESSPLTILLQGSFARGEGTVRFDEDGEPMLWRDLDLMLVYRTRERPSVLEAIEADLASLPGVHAEPTTIAGGNVSLAQMPLFAVRRWRDLKTFELAHGSRLLAGRDIRPSMRVRDGRIPLESGERFLLQKAIGLCLVFPHLEDAPLTANYEVSKLYLEIASALALKEGHPSPDFDERLAAMRASADERVAALAERAASVGRYKVEGDMEALRGEDAAALWSTARTDLLSALSILHESRGGDALSLDDPKALWAYYRDLSRRFLPTTFATVTGSRWPPWAGQRALGRFAHRMYTLYYWAALGGRRDIVRGCPLSAVYCGALSLLSDLEPGTPPEHERSAAQDFFALTGQRIEPDASAPWTRQLERMYFRAIGPLYGVG